MNVARFDAPVAVTAPVVLFDAVTGDAGHPFANDRRRVEQTVGAIDLQLRSDGKVTTNAKRSDGSLGVFGHRLFKPLNIGETAAYA